MTDAEGGVTSFTFDAVSNMLSLTDPVGNTTTWTYDALNQVLTDTNELGNSRSFDYDEIGNLVERTDRNSKVREFDFDALRRLTKERWVDGTTVVNTLDYNYDAASQLLDASDNSSSYTFAYDQLGRRTSVDNLGTPGVPNVVLTSDFDAVGNRTSLSATIDGTADFLNSYAYDALSRMTSVQQSGVGILPATDKRVDFSYNAAGQFTGIDLGQMFSQARDGQPLEIGKELLERLLRRGRGNRARAPGAFSNIRLRSAEQPRGASEAAVVSRDSAIRDGV